MHIPDGVIGPGVSAAAGVVAAGGFGFAVSRARRYLTDRLVPLAALVTAFVFAGQMINFPVLPGMSGHLIGGLAGRLDVRFDLLQTREQVTRSLTGLFVDGIELDPLRFDSLSAGGDFGELCGEDFEPSV